MEAHGNGGHGVVEVVGAEEVAVDIVDVVTNLKVEVHVGRAAHIGAAYVCTGTVAVGYAVGVGLCYRHQVLIVGVYEDEAVFG